MTKKNSPAPAPSFPVRANGHEVRMLVQGPGTGTAIETCTDAGGKRRVVGKLGLIRSAAGGTWVTSDLDGNDEQVHATQFDALARFA